MMTVRADTAASEASAVNKYHPLISDSSGRLWTATTAVGPTAEGANATANPEVIGVEARTTSKTAVGDGEVVRVQGDSQGRVVVTGAPRDLVTVTQTTIATSTSETTIVAAVSDVYNDITTLIISNDDATPGTVTFRDSDGGTTRLILFIPSESTTTINFGLTPLVQATVNEPWTAQSDTEITSLYITAITTARL